MKTLDSHSLPNKFLKAFLPSSETLNPRFPDLIETLMTGIIVQEKPSPNKIHNELVKGESKRTFYRKIHGLAVEMPYIFSEIIRNIQNSPQLGMKSDGVMIIDEHIMPHTSDKMEGVGYFYSTTDRGSKLGLSMLSTHYYRNHVEYPLSFQFYRKMDELKKLGKESLFKKKNTIARELLGDICAYTNAPDLILMDSFFMTKDNCQFLQKKVKTYISRPKRNWNCNYNHKKQSITELFESIPQNEFQDTLVKNPKTRKTKKYNTAIRNAFFSKIGTHRIVFISFDNIKIKETDVKEMGEILETSTNRKFAVIITNNTNWSATEILSLYSLRWPIETGYRDMNQNIGLHGCQWRELSGQYCFTALSFLAYIFLIWARSNGGLTRYGVNQKTLGQLKIAFIHYCQEEFAKWFSKIYNECDQCQMTNWIYKNIYNEGKTP